MIEKNAIVPFPSMQKERRRDIPPGYEDFNNDWFLSPRGDMCNAWTNYEIFDYNLAQNDLIIHLMEKNWFDANTFLPAYFEACKRCGIQHLQIRTFYQ